MVPLERPVTRDPSRDAESAEVVKSLHDRVDALMGRLHELTKRRDRREIGFQESLPVEQSLVAELGQIQDRLRTLGSHAYDCCKECRPLDVRSAPTPTERNDYGR
jgi:hypothetical protein